MDALLEISAKYSIDTLSNVFNLIFQGVEGMRYSSYPRAALEMIFIKAVKVGEVVPVSTLLGRLDALLAAEPVSLPPAPSPPKKTETKIAEPACSTDLPSSKVIPAQKSSPTGHIAQPTPASVAKNNDKNELEKDSISAQNKLPETPVVSKSKDLERDWDGFVAHVKERKKWMASALELSQKAMENAGELIIKFDESSECLYLQESEKYKITG